MADTTNNSTFPLTFTVTFSDDAPVTAQAHHVGAVYDLLSQAADFGLWTTPETPTVKRYWGDVQNERGPGAGQPPIAYVWSPTSAPGERFSMDGDRYDRTRTVEVQVWSLDEHLVRETRDNAADILGRYIDDNAIDTPYSTVEPSDYNDFREQKSARRTDHYIMTLEIEARALEATGKP